MTGIGLLVGGWFASAVISRVLEKAQRYAGGNYELNRSTKKLVDTLTGKLALCQETVKVAERRMIDNRNLANYLKMLKDAVYDAEDVLDDMEAKSIKDQVQAGKNKVSEIASSSVSVITNMFLPDGKNKSLKEVVDKLNKIHGEISTFLDLVKMNIMDESNDLELSGQRETTSLPLEEIKLYGRQQEYFDLILKMVLHLEPGSSKKKKQNYNRGLLVIPIVGMGGVGKTALAQAVYNNPEVKQTFRKKPWISVSYNLDIKLVMRKLIQSLGGSLRLDVMTLEDISNNLSRRIYGVRFLVVLDDICEKIESQWDILYKTFSRGSPSSVILITTQNQAFADRVGSFGPLVLNPLEPEILWDELLKNFVFGSMDISEEKRNNLALIGKQIACKLHGLPLAAKIIGNLLRCNINEEYWRRISRSEWWDRTEVKSQILPSIAIGYQHLDPCLRQCFAYCSVFPRNSLLDKDRLVQMWIAQNFIHHDGNGARKIEDIGREWFDKLVEMYFFQPAWDYNGYVIPNLMHDLALIVSSEECFYLTDQSNEIPQGVRHLAVDTKNLNVLQRIPKQNHIRSFFYFGFPHVNGTLSTINEILCNMESIRVLDLSYLHMKTKEPPKAIENLTHLRFLDLSSTGIEVLSHSFLNNHYHLQALHIQLPYSTSEFCRLVKLPRGINKLINLRHLNADAETIAQISGIGKLVNLQELYEYRVGETEGHKITELKNLRELTGHLTIKNCENIRSREEAEKARLTDKKNLDSVELFWSGHRRESKIDKEILEGLKPYDGIIGLTIDGYKGPSFPDWMTDRSLLLNLQTIELYSCTNIQALPPLGKLPSLKRLLLIQLNSVKMIDHCLYGINETAFPALTHFISTSSTSCGEWTKPTCASSFFPCLSSLEIENSIALREVPFHCFSASLKVLKIKYCHNLNSLAESLHHLTSLNLLHINYCNMSISLNINGLNLLEDLVLGNCPELSIEGDLQSLTNLKCLEIRACPKLLSNSMHDITNKQKGKNLQVHQAEGLRSLSDLKMDQSLLRHDYHLILGGLPSLRFLLCHGLDQSKLTMDQTLWFQELTSLQELTFANSQLVPSSIVTLPSLRKLLLQSCYDLPSLPGNGGMPDSLLELALQNCSHHLEKRCKPGGEDWSLIDHVLVIRINGRVIGRPQIRVLLESLARFHPNDFGSAGVSCKGQSLVYHSGQILGRKQDWNTLMVNKCRVYSRMESQFYDPVDAISSESKIALVVSKSPAVPSGSLVPQQKRKVL